MKKVILTLIAVFALTVTNAQMLVINETDEFTGAVKKITKSYTIAKGVSKLKIAVGQVDALLAFYLTPSLDLGCGGSRSNYVIFKFTDGTTVKYSEDVADIDCGDNATSIYVADKTDIEGKTIEKIRFSQSESYDDCTVGGEYTVNELITAVTK